MFHVYTGSAFGSLQRAASVICFAWRHFSIQMVSFSWGIRLRFGRTRQTRRQWHMVEIFKVYISYVNSKFQMHLIPSRWPLNRRIMEDWGEGDPDLFDRIFNDWPSILRMLLLPGLFCNISMRIFKTGKIPHGNYVKHCSATEKFMKTLFIVFFCIHFLSFWK